MYSGDEVRKTTRLIVLGLIVIMYFVILIPVKACSRDSFQGTVVDRIIDRGNTYLVIENQETKEREVFENEDSWMFFKFNSNDFLMNIKDNKRYTFEVVGWRFPPFSMYRNILSFTDEVP